MQEGVQATPASTVQVAFGYVCAHASVRRKDILVHKQVHWATTPGPSSLQDGAPFWAKTRARLSGLHTQAQHDGHGTVECVNEEQFSVKPCVWLCPYGRLACSKRRLRPRLVAPCACAMAATSTMSVIAARCILLLQSPASSGLVRGSLQQLCPEKCAATLGWNAGCQGLADQPGTTQKPGTTQDFKLAMSTWDNQHFLTHITSSHTSRQCQSLKPATC